MSSTRNHRLTRRGRIVLAAIGIVLAVIAAVACGSTKASGAHHHAGAVASAAASNPAFVQAEGNLGTALAAGFAPGQRHPVTTIINTLRTDPMFRTGAGRKLGSCMLRWLTGHRHSKPPVTLTDATNQASVCETGKP